MLEKLPESIGHALINQRAGRDCRFPEFRGAGNSPRLFSIAPWPWDASSELMKDLSAMQAWMVKPPRTRR
jgi:hypothetical protein